MTPQELKERIREIADFPRPGISFKDLTTLWQDGDAFRAAVDMLVEQCRGFGAEAVVCPEARGFVLGAAMAYALGVGILPVRRAGKLPAATFRGEYQLEYGTDVLEIHQDALRPGQGVLVVDDLLATGGTTRATMDLARCAGARVLAAAFLVELTALGGRDSLEGVPVFSLVRY